MVTMELAPVLFLGIVGDCEVVTLVSVAFSSCGGLWEVDRVFGMGEKGSCGSDSVNSGAGGVSALNVTCFSSSGFVGLDDMAMDVLGAFSVIDGLNDMSTMTGGCCGGGRGLVWVAMSAMVGLDLFLGLKDTPSDCSSSSQCS